MPRSLKMKYPGSLTLFLCAIAAFSLAQIPRDPENYFGESFAEALAMSRSFSPLIEAAGKSYALPSAWMSAVVFPELIRYNRFRDLAETTVVEQAYVRFGKSVADFSIGPFQMKPSFVEGLEEEIKSHPNDLRSFGFITRYLALDSTNIRRERVRRLKDIRWQIHYLACFTTIASKLPAISSAAPDVRRLARLAAAYNGGLKLPPGTLDRLIQQRTFPYGDKMPTGFSYSDVAVDYLQRHSKEIFSTN